MFIQFEDKYENRTITINSNYIISIKQGYITKSGGTIGHGLDVLTGTTSSGTDRVNSSTHYEINDSDYERIIKQLLSV